MTIQGAGGRKGCRGRRGAAVGSLLLLACLCTLSSIAGGQLISLKTVPIAEGDQFMIFPSRNLAMGGVSIALADSLLDPFVNPATAIRGSVESPRPASYFFGAPVFFSASRNSGGGRTLPLGGLLRSRAWAAGFTMAVQQIDRVRAETFGMETTPLAERSSYNQYAFGMLTRRFDGAGISVGASGFWAGLDAIDGVDLLYAGSTNIEQSGGVADLRLGLLKEWQGDRSLELLLLHNRVRMTHDVTYVDWRWDMAAQRSIDETRLEHNLDRTNTWGAHVKYDRPVGSQGWRVGGVLTGNVKEHPKIPDYEIMDIPKDPGHSYAYDFGLGVAKIAGPVTFGMDAIVEPAWSNSWAEAEAPTPTSGGGTIPVGGKTIVNDFRFANATVRVGVAREVELASDGRQAGFQLGLSLRSIHYWLDQQDRVANTVRSQEEHWLEWSPTWGASVRFNDLEIGYLGRSLHGTGRPGVRGPTFATPGAELASSDFIVAPKGPLTLRSVRVLTHQVSVSVPLR
jgi:hypothetical protein